MTDYRIVLVTCSSEEEASRIARALVEERLAACVNILESPVRSVYRWKGRVETAMEHLLFIKTRRARLKALESAVKRLHSYDTPEVIALPITAGSRRYLAWLDESVRPDASDKDASSRAGSISEGPSRRTRRRISR